MESTEETTGHPTWVEALRAILGEDLDDDLVAHRIMIRVRYSGEVVYRIFPPNSDDYVGGSAMVDR